jgi:hypothetical protein
MRRRLSWILAALAGLLLLALVWFGLSSDPEITALRNTVHYRVVQWLGGVEVRLDEPPGRFVGEVVNPAGKPVSGATVLVASPLGDTYTATSGEDGRYEIDGVPPGRYVPVAGKRGHDEALLQTCLGGLCYKDAVAVRPGGQARSPDLILHPSEPPVVVLDNSLAISPTAEVEVGAPFPGSALRTHFAFERAGLWVNDCWLYEPLAGDGPFPTMLLVLPGPVKGWEIVPVPFAAEGFSVLACYPLRGIDIDEDVVDLLTALEYLRQGRVASRADPEHLALVGASFTSLHTYRLLALTDEFDVSLVLGGLVDGFAFRHDVETGAVEAREPFDQVLIALGFPNSSPELYFKYSSLYHLDGLPPLCLLHGTDDELAPFSQSVQLAEALDRRKQEGEAIDYEFYSYQGLKHYFSTSADNATTQQMFQDSLDCLWGFLEGE